MSAIPKSAATLGRRGRLELGEVLAALVADGLLAAEDAKRIGRPAAPAAVRSNCIRWW